MFRHIFTIDAITITIYGAVSDEAATTMLKEKLKRAKDDLEIDLPSAEKFKMTRLVLPLK